jgi:hypothetical protein
MMGANTMAASWRRSGCLHRLRHDARGSPPPRWRARPAGWSSSACDRTSPPPDRDPPSHRERHGRRHGAGRIHEQRAPLAIAHRRRSVGAGRVRCDGAARAPPLQRETVGQVCRRPIGRGGRRPRAHARDRLAAPLDVSP